MKTLQPTISLGLSADIISTLDRTDCDDLTELMAGVMVRAAEPQTALRLKKVRLINTAWILLCLVILTGSLLFALYILAK